MALKQCTSLLSSLASLLISPENVYLDTVVLPETQHVQAACKRAFGTEGRMSQVASTTWSSGYRFRPFHIRTTSREFRYSRRATPEPGGSTAGPGSKASNVAILWTPGHSEVIINGILQGRRRGDVRGASLVSRRKMTEMLKATVGAVGAAERGGSIKACLEGTTSYLQLKACQETEERRKVKREVTARALRGWHPNEPDDFPLVDGA